MKQTGSQRSLPEVVTYVVSLAVLSLLVGVLGYLWITGNDDPPSFEVEPHLSEIARRNDAYYLPVSVTNLGDQSTQEVAVEVTFGEETRTFMIAMIPGGATRSGTVVFPQNPADGEVTAEVVSFITT